MKSMMLIAPAMAGLALAAAAVPAQARPTKIPAHPAKAACHQLTPAKADALFDRFNGAWSTLDPDHVTGLFDDDAVLLATVANTPRTDHAGIRDYFVKFLRNKPVGKIDSSTFKAGCNWALRMGTWTVTLTDPNTGAKNDVKARYTFLYQFEDGHWKIEHLHSSAMPEK